MNSLPVLECRFLAFGAPAADPFVPPWSEIEPVFLRKTESAEPPEQATSIRVGWDGGALRLLFVCEDSEPWSTFTTRDAPLYKEEVVEVFLDPEGDGCMYFELEVNLNNAVLDGCMRRISSGYRKDFRWRCENLQTAVQRIPGGWVAEWAIPFESVALSAPQEGQKWRANFTRIDRPSGRARELSAWSPTGLCQFHVPQKFGFLEFRGR